MLEEKKLRNHLSSCDLIRVNNRLWRELKTEYILKSNPEPLYSEGPLKSGARFTPKGGFRSLYLTFNRLTASLEIEASFKKSDGSLIDLADTPTTTLPIDVTVDSVLDLTDHDTLDLIKSNTTELTGEWRYSQLTGEAITQMLGRVAFESARIKGLKYISAKDPRAGRCLTIFVDRLDEKKDKVSCIDKSKNLSAIIP